MKDIMDLAYDYNRINREYGVYNEKLESGKKNLEYLKENNMDQVIIQSSEMAINTMSSMVEEKRKEKDFKQLELFNKIDSLSKEEKNEFLNTLDAYSKMDDGFISILEEIKNRG